MIEMRSLNNNKALNTGNHASYFQEAITVFFPPQ